MSREPEPPPSKPRGGCLMSLVSLILVFILGGIVMFAVQPQSLSNLQTTGTNKNLKEVLTQSLKTQVPLTLSEGEINHWLAKTLKAKQGGLLSKKVSLDKVAIRLEKGRAEVIMLRHAMGYPFTVSMYLTLEKRIDAHGAMLQVHPTGGPFLPDYPKIQMGGRIGKLPVPQGFLHLILPSYLKLAEPFPEEIDLALMKMSKIHIEPHALNLDPRELNGSALSPSQ